MAKAKTPTQTQTPAPAAADPALDSFGQGLSALQAKDWAKAVEHLERTVELTDVPELRDRARQLLTVARQKGGIPDGKTPPAVDAGGEANPFLQAVYEKNRGNFKTALEIAQKGGRDQKDERFAYLVAAIHAAEDRIDEAVQALSKAVELNPKNRIHAFHDADFAELRKNHRHLFGLS
jgi:tetratricopeptide (TPR) repeat protein